MRTVLVRAGAAAAASLLLATACGAGGGSAPQGGGPRIVVTTSILGDVVRNLVGDAAEVEVVMPPGSDPHDFAPSARQAQAMRSADVLVVNGLGFEVALLDTIEAAASEGVPLVAASDGITATATGGVASGGAAQGGVDPHFFTDPVLMQLATSHVADGLVEHVSALDTARYRERVSGYLASLEDLDRDIAEALAVVPAEQRVLVTNHEVFTYFADRYGFEVLGTVIPAVSTLAEPSAAGLTALAAKIREAGVPAIFAETSSSTRLAKALADEGASVQVVELYSEALGAPDSEGATYLSMMRTNATRIAAALSRRG